MARVLSLAVWSVVVVGCSTGGEASRAGPEGGSPAALSARDRDAHLQVAVGFSPEGLKVLTAARVEGPLSKPRGTVSLPWRLEVFDAKGGLVHEAGLPAASELRGEFQGEGGRMEAAHLLVGTGAFPVTMPAVQGTFRVLAQPQTLPVNDPRSKGTEWVLLGELPVPSVTP